MNESYNAVIVGQTGVGKSTLINYLYGQSIVDVGLGKPVTKNGFHPIEFVINGLPVTLYDSWGLEVGKWEQWMAELNMEFADRGVDQPANKWFHSVFYCIQAGSHRIQECDIHIINAFINENYRVSVILTKADCVSLEEETTMRQCLHEQIPGIPIIAVCSESKVGRMGKTQQFGKEDVEQQAYNDFFDSLIERLPLRCKILLEDKLKDWATNSKNSAYNDVGMFGNNTSKAKEFIKESSTTLLKELRSIASEEFKSTLSMYGDFSARLGYPPPSLDNEAQNSDEIFQTPTHKETSLTFDFSDFGSALATTIATLCLPAIVVYALATTRDSDADNLKLYISDCQEKINKEIEKITEKVRDILLSAKHKTLGC